MPYCDTLLPPNRTELEKALEQVMCQRLQALDPEIIRKLWNPWECPLGLLPWLAWALSVDIWDDDWSEQTKRQLVASSVQLHRKKGTLWAINQALNNLGVDAEITEWWQQEPPGRNGTAILDMDVVELMQNQVSPDQLIQSIERVKRYSIWIEYIMRDALDVQSESVTSGFVTVRDAVDVDQFILAACPECTGLVTVVVRDAEFTQVAMLSMQPACASLISIFEKAKVD